MNLISLDDWEKPLDVILLEQHRAASAEGQTGR